MRMTLHTDYALRMLIYVASRRDGVCTVSDVAQEYGLSRNHLLKVAQTLRDLELIETTRGRAGGIWHRSLSPVTPPTHCRSV